MMTSTYPTPGSGDAAGLAVAVRDLALTSHRMLRDPQVGPGDLRALSQRTTRLLRLLEGSPSNPLAHWLRSLRHRVDATLRDRNFRPTIAYRREVAAPLRSRMASSRA